MPSPFNTDSIVERFCSALIPSTLSMTVTSGCVLLYSSKLRSHSVWPCCVGRGRWEWVVVPGSFVEEIISGERTPVGPQLVNNGIKRALLLKRALAVYEAQLDVAPCSCFSHGGRQVARHLRRRWYRLRFPYRKIHKNTCVHGRDATHTHTHTHTKHPPSLGAGHTQCAACPYSLLYLYVRSSWARLATQGKAPDDQSAHLHGYPLPLPSQP
jgi:hypothetical protein